MFTVNFVCNKLVVIEITGFKSVTIEIKATEQYFPMVLFIMLYKVALAFESVN